MGKWCPLYNKKVVYLDCLECDDRENCGKNDRYLPEFLKNTEKNKEDINSNRIQTLQKKS